MRKFAVVLAHYPILDRSGNVITTAVTNIDVHDLARSSYSYGSSALFVVHPVQAQRTLVLRIREHWVSGSGAKRIPDRAPPMGIVEIVPDLVTAYQSLGGGRDGVEVWTTSAKAVLNVDQLSYAQGRERLNAEGKPVVLVFGTGWGLAENVLADADVHLPSIVSVRPTGFNHLSVRAACAVTLDRLLGQQ